MQTRTWKLRRRAPRTRYTRRQSNIFEAPEIPPKRINVIHLAVVTGREGIRLQSEKEIVVKDGETGGTEEFVVVDVIPMDEEQLTPIVEAKRASLGQAVEQCLLSMKDARDPNGGGCSVLYGFVTTGKGWQMLRCDGALQITER